MRPAERILFELGIERPDQIDLDAIAWARGAAVKYRPLDKCEAMIVGTQRRAIITDTVHRGRLAVLQAEAPLANLFGYSSAMRGLSQGRATCSMEPASYGPAPQEVADGFM